MRVIDVRTTIVAIPLSESVEMPTIGTDYAITNVVVQVETDQGLVGLGEAIGSVHPEGVELLIQKLAKDYLIGHDPFAVESFIARVYGSTRWQFFRGYANLGVAALETACWDIIGKAAGLPVHKLLGGAVRDRVDCFRWIQRKAPAAMAAEAKAAVDAGFSVIYIKIGKAPKLDLEMVRQIREAIGPDARLRIDANEAWTPTEAVQRIEELKPFGIDFMEQPVEKHDLDGLVFVRRTTGIPICIDQGAHLQWDIQRALRAGAADYVCTEPCRTGGLLPMKKTAALIENANALVCRHVDVETGISNASCLQVCSTIPNLCLGNQSAALLLSDDIVDEDLRTHVDGKLPVPTGPGLGVTLNEARALRRPVPFRRFRQRGGASIDRSRGNQPHPPALSPLTVRGQTVRPCSWPSAWDSSLRWPSRRKRGCSARPRSSTLSWSAAFPLSRSFSSSTSGSLNWGSASIR